MHFFYTLVTALLGFSGTDDLRFEINGFAQGTTYHIVYYAKDSIVRKHSIDSIFTALDSSLSIYKSYSCINAFNKSDEGLLLDKHLVAVVQKAMDTYRQTAGIFDITVFPLVQAWGFAAKKQEGLPDSSIISNLKTCVNSNLLTLKGAYLSKARPCVQIDVNGIAQGYSVDVVAAFLRQQHIHDFVAEVGGELIVSGRKPGGGKMAIGIEAPANDDREEDLMQQVLHLDEGAVTTSGSYRRYYESNGKKITHIINPFTGYPEINELISVTVYAKDAITADAYDNALMVMGLQKAMAFINNRNDLAAYFIYRGQDGSVTDTATAGFKKLLQ